MGKGFVSRTDKFALQASIKVVSFELKYRCRIEPELNLRRLLRIGSILLFIVRFQLLQEFLEKLLRVFLGFSFKQLVSLRYEFLSLVSLHR